MKRNFREFIDKKAREYGDKFDVSYLSHEFVPYYENGKRITVQFSSGEVKRGTVGVTTGWKPVFLLMLRRNSVGSEWTLGENDHVIKAI
jgi:hypothetical protein